MKHSKSGGRLAARVPGPGPEHDEGAPVPRNWGPGRLRTSIGRKKPAVSQDRFRQTPFSPVNPQGLGNRVYSPERTALHPQRLNVEHQGGSTRSQPGSGRQRLFPSPAKGAPVFAENYLPPAHNGMRSRYAKMSTGSRACIQSQHRRMGGLSAGMG